MINKKDHQFIYVSPFFACDLIQCVANLTVFAFGIYSYVRGRAEAVITVEVARQREILMGFLSSEDDT